MFLGFGHDIVLFVLKLFICIHLFINLFIYGLLWTTALSNSMKLSHAMWGHPRQMGHGGEV